MRSCSPSAGRWAGPAAGRSACSPTSRTRPPSSAGCARWRRTAAGRSGSCSPTAATIPQRWRRLMDGVRAARADNLPLSAQVAGRPVGLTLGLGTSLNPFALREAFAAARQAAAGRDAGEAARPRDAPHDPGAGGLAAAARGAAAAVAPDRDALGPHVPAGRSAGLRAAAGEQHRRHGGARRRYARPSSATTIWSAAMAGGWCISPSPTTCTAISRWCAS